MAEVLLFLSTTSSFLFSPSLSLSFFFQKTLLFFLALLSKYWAGPLARHPLAHSQEKSQETSVAKCSLIHMITVRLQTEPHLLQTYCCEENTSYSVCRLFFQVLQRVDEVMQRSVLRAKLLLDTRICAPKSYSLKTIVSRSLNTPPCLKV